MNDEQSTINNHSKSLSNSVRRWVYVILATAITIALLAWALRGVSLALVVRAWQQARVEWLCLGLIVFLASFLVRAKRWGTLLGANRDPGGFGIRQGAIFIGFACNCILPGRVGEVVRALVLHRKSEVPLGAAFGSIVTARLLDAIVAFVLLLVSLLAIAKSGETNLATLPLGSIALVLVFSCVAFFLAAWYPEAIARGVAHIFAKIGLGRWSFRIVSTLRGLLTGLDALRYPGRCLTAVVETFCIWGLMGITFWFCAIAFGIISPGFMGSLFLQSVVALAIALPSSPGYVGPFEAGIRFGLEIYQVSPDVIVAYAITLHFLMNASITIIGLTIAMLNGLSWKDFIAVKSPSSKPFSSDIITK